MHTLCQCNLSRDCLGGCQWRANKNSSRARTHNKRADIVSLASSADKRAKVHICVFIVLKLQTHPIFILEPDCKSPAIGGLEANRFKCNCLSIL